MNIPSTFPLNKIDQNPYDQYGSRDAEYGETDLEFTCDESGQHRSVQFYQCHNFLNLALVI
ncbi:hypothetical protein FDI76_gp027 [Serratia phage vB_Sru_IME250]|uniref:Uncharacterized protein n=1 Tax=Serratia phage vB_Sru_IME250 TaxID=1852640 RepID=A0A1J0MFY9_9CAUD|nr:hypothetical protein FDI76_gp027 [Serratia phage vB_Sru_IME250]ANM47136.1 hypothetical protein [Serratia phage vB_Sru_IME250]APD20044.1 hypothetical protein [Serratia phage vB_Sru_IME250]